MEVERGHGGWALERASWPSHMGLSRQCQWITSVSCGPFPQNTQKWDIQGLHGKKKYTLETAAH